jgi:hypothetical protein
MGVVKLKWWWPNLQGAPLWGAPYSAEKGGATEGRPDYYDLANVEVLCGNVSVPDWRARNHFGAQRTTA